MAIKPNKISLIDYETKALVKTQSMRDLKCWYSGDGYYNLMPVFLLNPSPSAVLSQQGHSPSSITSNHFAYNPKTSNPFASFFRFNSHSNEMNKLFVIEYRSCKWHLQIDDFHSLKSITCILLDQSLDMGIDNNPLMLDLTISEHFQSKYKLLASQNIYNRGSHMYHQSHLSSTHSKKRQNTHSAVDKKSAVSNISQNSKGFRGDTSPTVSIMVNQRQQSMMTSGGGANSGECDVSSEVNGSFSLGLVTSEDQKGKAQRVPSVHPPMPSLFSSANGTNLGVNYSRNKNGFYSSTKSPVTYKYELEFQELQLILLWFPEEVAFRLTEVEYELFKQVHPSEYLRHATLDMNNFKSINEKADGPSSSKSVQDLIVRYKEVSSWIKKLIQTQPSAEKRLAIILSAIRCAITCWNIGNFNSSREIWLGLK